MQFLSKTSCAITRRGLIFRKAAVKGANHTPMYPRGLISKVTFPCFFGSCLSKISPHPTTPWLSSGVAWRSEKVITKAIILRMNHVYRAWVPVKFSYHVLQGIYDSNQYSCEYNAPVLLETGNTSFIESDQNGDLAVLMSFQDRPKS